MGAHDKTKPIINNSLQVDTVYRVSSTKAQEQASLESELSPAPKQEVSSFRGAKQDGDHFNHPTLCRITCLGFFGLWGLVRFPQDEREKLNSSFGAVVVFFSFLFFLQWSWGKESERLLGLLMLYLQSLFKKKKWVGGITKQVNHMIRWRREPHGKQSHVFPDLHDYGMLLGEKFFCQICLFGWANHTVKDLRWFDRMYSISSLRF